MSTPAELARDFLENEKQFRLGAAPTEQSHPKTRDLSDVIARDTAEGVRLLLSVDEDVAPMARRLTASPEWLGLVAALERAIATGGRVTFTGCGATGRLSIMLEMAWRHYWQKAGRADGDMEDRLRSVMAGGDYALVRSVEGFEDFTEFGRYQLRRSGVAAPGAPADAHNVVVAITEGGETSFVIGTAWEALDSGAEVFFVYNNPSDVLAGHVERSREVIEDPRITNICLYTGQMAVAGSTRMQATTTELLLVGAALETALCRAVGEPEPRDAGDRFEALLAALVSDEAVEAMAGMIGFEESVYGDGGRVTYLASDFMLDIFTDTTERSPTFALPPFRRDGDTQSPPPWAFVKDPTRTTTEAWREALGREPRCLEWDASVYEELGAPEMLRQNPPALGLADIMRFRIGCESDPSRTGEGNAGVAVVVGGEGASVSEDYERRAALLVGDGASAPDGAESVWRIPVAMQESPLRLDAHLAVKLALNTVSTGTMARMGRVRGNWMVWVQPTNKKLIDRGTRLIADLGAMSYDDACVRLFESIAEVETLDPAEQLGVSPVARALSRA